MCSKAWGIGRPRSLHPSFETFDQAISCKKAVNFGGDHDHAGIEAGLRRFLQILEPVLVLRVIERRGESAQKKGGRRHFGGGCNATLGERSVNGRDTALLQDVGETSRRPAAARRWRRE